MANQITLQPVPGAAKGTTSVAPPARQSATVQGAPESNAPASATPTVWGDILGTVTDQTDLVQWAEATHFDRVDNPHQVTKAQVGLGNVDNTADLDKPVSNAQAAINAGFSATDASLQSQITTLGASGAATQAEVDALEASKVDRAGDTMTGALNFSSAAPIGIGISSSGSPYVNMQKGASGQSVLFSGYTGLNLRWQQTLGDVAAETGADVGSNFAIDRYNDAGALLGRALTIVRCNGHMSLGPGAVRATALSGASTGVNSSLELSKASGVPANVQLVGTSNGSIRWVLRLGDGEPEVGSNTGSHFSVTRYDDAGVAIATVMRINRQRGNLQLPGQACFYANGCNAAASGSNITWSNTQLNVGNNFNGATGTFTAPDVGVYLFEATAMGAAAAAGEVRLFLRKNGADIVGTGTIVVKGAGQFMTAHTRAIISLAAGDFVQVRNNSSPEPLFSADPNFSSFMGYMLG